jgi:hypothetical protein
MSTLARAPTALSVVSLRVLSRPIDSERKRSTSGVAPSRVKVSALSNSSVALVQSPGGAGQTEQDCGLRRVVRHVQRLPRMRGGP